MRWSKKQQEFLEKYYEKGEKDFLCEKLGRNWDAIRVKANSLGLERDDGSAMIDANLDNIKDHIF